MHVKVLTPEAQQFSEPAAVLVKLASRGLLGSDRTVFEKRAGAWLAHELHKWASEMPADEPLIHLLALGATEDYGCFAGDTPFALGDGRYIPIKDVTVGMPALSADGRVFPVTHLFRRRVDASLALSVWGLPDPLQVSLNHPFRVARQEQFRCRHDAYKRCFPITQGAQNICLRPVRAARACTLEACQDVVTDWEVAETARVGDFLVWTRPDLAVHWDMSVEEGYLLGAWLAEGCFQRKRPNPAVLSVRLDTHRNEKAFHTQMTASAAALGLRARTHFGRADSRHKNCAVTCVTGDPARFRRWHAEFGEHAKYKVIPPWVCCLPQPTLLAIIAGYLDGDGSCVVNEKENRTTARSHGAALAAGFQRLCWAAGIPAVRCRAGGGWNVSIANSYLRDVEQFSWKVRGRDLRQTTKVHGFYHHGRMYLPIRAVHESGPLDVFNVEVDGDHTYSGPNVDSHNCNRNGDGFKRAACREYHPTFVKYARLYRDHANKVPQKSYGRVKRSAWNDKMQRVELLVGLNGSHAAAARNDGLLADREMEKLAAGKEIAVSMACVTDPNYPVLTRDRGYVPISQIAVDDMVWTHKARWRRVRQLNRRPYTGEVHCFKVNGLPLPLELTADHPMMAKVFAGSREVGAMQAKARRYFTDPACFEAAPADWTHAAHLGAGDRLFYQPISRYPGYGAISDAALAALMGYYIAEGSLNFNGDRACTIKYSCNLGDSLPRRVPKLIGAMYPDLTVGIAPRANSVSGLSVKVHNTEFAEFMRNTIGAGVRSKQVPPELFNSEPAVALAFLGAWLDGDGWVDKKGGHWSTCSPGLALQCRDLLVAAGIPSSIYKIDHRRCATSGYENSGDEYTVNVSHLDLWQLAGASEKVADYPTPSRQRTKPAAMRRCADGSYAYRISSVTTRHVSDVVTYNFEVEEDESYSLGGFVSHNCMVPFDVCSYCNNKAPTRRDYCDSVENGGHCKAGGLKHNMGSLVEIDGGVHQLHADNPNPKFFDISHVFRPADRIAFVSGALTKAAAHGAARVGGAELAAMLGVTLPGELLVEAAESPQVKRLAKLASMLADAEQQPTDPRLAAAFTPELQTMQSLPNWPREKCGQVFAALAEQRALLPLPAFLTLFAGQSEKTAQTTAAIVARELPGAYTRLRDRVDLLERLQTSPYTPAGTASDACRLWAVKHAAAWSLRDSAAQRRIALTHLRGLDPPAVRAGAEKQAAASDDAASKLADEYALYKLAFLATIPDNDPELQLTLTLALLQNYAS